MTSAGNTLTTGQPTVDGARSVAGVELQTPTGGWTLGGSGTLTLGDKGIDAQAFENGTNTISLTNIVMGSSSTSTWALSVSANSFLQNTTTNISSNIQLHETAELQIQSPRGGGGSGGNGFVNLSGIISNTTDKTTSGPLKYLGGSASRNFYTVTGLNTYTGNTLISQAVVNFNSLADEGFPSAFGSSGIINVTENSSFSTISFNGTAPASTNRRLTIGLALAGAAGAANVNNNAATANTLSFTSSDSIINGGSGNRSFSLGGTNTGNNLFAQSIDNAASGVTTFSKGGAGRWILSNPNNSYTGSTTLAGGFLHVSKLADGGENSSIGASSNAAANLVFNGGELTYTGATDSTDRLMTFAASGNIINNGDGPLSFTNTGAIAHTGTAARSLNLGGSYSATNNLFALQIIDGAGAAVTSLGSRGGRWELTNNGNTFTGGIVFGTASTTGGTLVFGNDSVLGVATGTITFTGSGNLVASGNATLGAARNIAVASGRAANFGISSGSGTTLVVESKITGPGGVSRVSGSSFTTGAVRYANDSNDYTGSFSTRFGISEFTSVADAGSASALGAGSVINADNSASAAILRYVGGGDSSTNRPINWSATTGALYLESSGSGKVSFLSDTALVTGNGNKTLFLGGSNSGDNTLAQPIGDGPDSGITSLEKAGAGKWILTAVNNYTGNTTVGQGTLALGVAATIAHSPTLSLAAGATLDLSAKGSAFVIPATQTLTGAGSVIGQGLDFAGTLAPGTNGIGTLSTAALTLAAGSVTNVQIHSSALTSDQIAVTGDLTIAATAVLNLADIAAEPAAVVDATLTIATYTGAISGTFQDLPEGATVNVGPSTFTISYLDNAITLTNGTGGGNAYTDWIATFTTLTTAEQKAKTADPDGDGQTNLVEFALDGNPESGANSGKFQSSIATVGATRHLTLTLPVRDGAIFSGSPSLSSTEVDGVSYTIQGSFDLSAFDASVVEVTPTITTTPTLSTGWSYKTFRLNADTGSQPRGFLRAEVSETTVP